MTVDRRSIQRQSRRQEERTAARYNGSRNPGSGSFWSRKNDVRSEHLLIENKLTGNKAQWTVKAKDLRDLTKEAIISDRIGVLQFDLGGHHYVILREDDFLELLGGQD